MKLPFKALRQRLQNYSVMTSNTDNGFASSKIVEQDSYTKKFVAASALNGILGGTTTSVKFVPKQPTNLQDSELQDGLTHNQTAQWSTSLQTLLDQPPSSIPYQMVLGGIAFCLAVATWANVAQIDEVGQATGRLIPQGEVYKIHPEITGKVAYLRVQEGQIVKAGEVIAQLDKEIALNEVERLTQESVAYQTQLLQIQGLMEKTRLEAKTRLALNNAEIEAQEAIITQGLAKIQSHQVAIAQGREKANISQKLLRQLQADAMAQNERLYRLKALVQQGALSQEQLFQAQQSLSDRQRTITQQMGEIQQTLADSKRSQIDLQQVLSESQRLQAQLTQKQVEEDTIQIQTEQAIQKLELEKTQMRAKVTQAEKQIAEAKMRLQQLTLTAPVDGVVLALNVRNSGEVVQPGQAIAELAPQNAPLVLEANLPTKEAGFVKVGNTTQIKFDAYPYQDYGIVSGQVISISPNSKLNEQLGAVYRVEIALEHNYVKANRQTIKFQAGQTAKAEIIIRRRRIADILLDPIKQLQSGGISL